MKVYAYDFFDTVVHRDCMPEDCIREWCNKISACFDFSINSDELFNIRKESREYGKSFYAKEETTYEELMHLTYEKCISKGYEIPLNESEFIDIAKEIEIAVEKKHIYKDDKVVRRIRKNKLHNRCILISDFYAGSFFYDEILKELGISDCFDELYISADIGYRKCSGKLYDYVLEKEKIKANCLWMHGDNIYSDVRIPYRKGMRAIYMSYKHLNSKKQYQYLWQTSFGNVEEKPFNGIIMEMFYFCTRLHEELIKRGYRDVLFCSREGQLLMKLFNVYQQEMGNMKWGGYQ